MLGTPPRAVPYFIISLRTRRLDKDSLKPISSVSLLSFFFFPNDSAISSRVSLPSLNFLVRGRRQNVMDVIFYCIISCCHLEIRFVSLSEKGCVSLLFPRQFLFLQFSSLLPIPPCCPQPHADPAEHPGGGEGTALAVPDPSPSRSAQSSACLFTGRLLHPSKKSHKLGSKIFPKPAAMTWLSRPLYFPFFNGQFFFLNTDSLKFDSEITQFSLIQSCHLHYELSQQFEAETSQLH